MDQTNVGNMNGYYQRQYSTEDLQGLSDIDSHDAMMGVLSANGMSNSGMMGNHMLDDIISNNNKELHRRRSFHQSHSYNGSNRMMQEPDSRRSSMLEFGSGSNNELDGYQFEPTSIPSNTGMQRVGSIAQRRLDSQRARRELSNEDLGLNTNFSNMASTYTPISSSSPYGHTMNSADSMGFDMSNTYMTGNMMLGMDYSSPGLDNGNNGSLTPRNTFNHNNFMTGGSDPPLQQDIQNSIAGHMHDPGGGNAGGLATHDVVEKVPNMQLPDQMPNMQLQNTNPQPLTSISDTNPATQVANQINDYQANPQPTPNLDITTNSDGLPYQGQGNGVQQVIPQYRNAYSSSGFDMLGVLMRVAARPKPQINIGAVDMSCAFVVCDVTQHDVPIVYCSDVFERLTAYTKHEILGRNCRFLQAPDGKIQAGVKRKYVDDDSVLRIKNMISQRQETQISIINYRKGGQPFMNLLTMIPITWDTDEVKYYVGFQVDLVEQPASITNKNPGMALVEY